MEKQRQTARTYQNPIHWQKDKSSISEKLYTRNEFIKWYLQGRKDAIEDEKKILLQKLEENIHLTQKIAERFIDEVGKIGINLYKVHLRINSIRVFDLLFVVDKDDFKSDRILEVYKKARGIKYSNEDFRIEFRFLPFHPELNSNRIVADGYLLSYGNLPKSGSSKT